jgi:hypothetical protein
MIDTIKYQLGQDIDRKPIFIVTENKENIGEIVKN